MLFEDLIQQLKKVKTEKDITPQLHDELINAGIVCVMCNIKEELKIKDDLVALELARGVVLKHFDTILLDMHDPL